MSASARGEALLQHARDLVVGEAVARLDGDRRLDARGLLARRHRQQAVGVDLEGDADARRAGDHRRDAAQLEARERAAVATELALALHDVDRHRRLAVLEGGELLRARGRDRPVARDDASRPGRPSSRGRATAESRRAAAVVAAPRVAGQRVGLDRRAERDHLVRDRGSSAAAGRRTRRPRARTAGMRVEPPTSTTPSTSAVVDLGVAQRLAHAAERAVDQRLGRSRRTRSRVIGASTARRSSSVACERRVDRRRRQRFLGRARGDQQRRACPRRASGGQPAWRERPAGERAVEVVAAERRVAAGRDHLEHALGQRSSEMSKVPPPRS